MKVLKTRGGNLCMLFSAGGIPPHPLIGAIQTPEGLIVFEWTADGFVNDDKTPNDMDICEGLEEWRAASAPAWRMAPSPSVN